VNRTELVEAVSTSAEIDRRVAEKAVMAVIDTVITQTRAGEKVSVFGFGTFNPTSRGARTGRNPQTGEPVKISASKGVRFSPAAAFKSALNTKAAGKKTASTKKAAPAKKSAAAKATTAKATTTKATTRRTADAPAAKKAARSTKKK
jgi:DNA-binding protein HU-beta